MYFPTKLKNVIIITFILIPFQFFGQQKLITLDIRQEPLSGVLLAISAQTGCRFSYDPQVVNPNKKVSVKVNSQSMQKVLPLILPSNITYKEVGKYVILKATPPKEEIASIDIVKPSTLNTEKMPSNAVGEEDVADTFQVDIITSLPEIIQQKEDSTLLVTSVNEIFIQNSSVSNNGTLDDTCHSNVTTIKTEKVKKNLVVLLAGLFSNITSQAIAQNTQEKSMSEQAVITTQAVELLKKNMQFTFVYPLGTDGINSFNTEYGFSFNLLGGNTGKINGAEIGSLYNINKYSVVGAQIAGLANITGVVADNPEESQSTQIAGLLNYNQRGNAQQIAGIANMSESSNMQIGGILNISKKASSIQIGGIGNISQSSNAQIGGIVNLSKQKSDAQIAGIVNATDTTQVQVAGIMNVALASDCQIGGIFNGTKKGGFQLGIINVRDTTDGVSVGLVNIVKKGGLIEGEAACGEIIHAAASFRSGSKKLYGIITLGYNFSDEFIAFGYGLGTEVALGKRLGLNFEGIHFNMYGQNFENDQYNGLVQLRPILNFKIAKHFKIFAGPTINLSIIAPDDITFTVPYSFWDYSANNGRELSAWVGFTAGLRF